MSRVELINRCIKKVSSVYTCCLLSSVLFQVIPRFYCLPAAAARHDAAKYCCDFDRKTAYGDKVAVWSMGRHYGHRRRRVFAPTKFDPDGVPKR